MGLDVGSRKIGVALSDPLLLTASPLTTLQRESLASDSQRLLRLASQYGVDRIVIGHPAHLEGDPSAVLVQITPLYERLRQAAYCPVVWTDERLSSKEAESRMAELKIPVSQRRRRRDEFAAALILEWYLQESNPTPEPEDPA